MNHRILSPESICIKTTGHEQEGVMICFNDYEFARLNTTRNIKINPSLLLRNCWKSNPDERPTADAIVDTLHKLRQN